MGRAKIISMINYKGGVGKTASAFNIAAGLSFLNNHSVLLIDLDPQCSLSYICMKAYSKSSGHTSNYLISDLKEEETINSVFRMYLYQELLDFPIAIDTTRLIKKNFYKGSVQRLMNFDFIPAMMSRFNQETGTQKRGLDDLEIDMVCKHATDPDSLIKNVTILAKFLTDYRLHEQYDFIIFDCPPSNNIITQNALVVSDYYLVPTIMDDMSTQGISHLEYVIKNTFLKELTNQYYSLIEKSPKGSYLSFLKSKNIELLGIFETLTKPRVDVNRYRQYVKNGYPGKLFDASILNYIQTGNNIGAGITCFEVEGSGKGYSKDTYGQLVYEILNRLGVKESIYARNLNSQL